MRRKMISPLSLMSARFKLRVICRILFLIFTTRLITVPGRMSAVSTLIPARLSFSFHIELVSHARAIFQRSLSHLRFLRFLSFVLLSPQFLNRFQTLFSPGIEKELDHFPCCPLLHEPRGNTRKSDAISMRFGRWKR